MIVTKRKYFSGVATFSMLALAASSFGVSGQALADAHKPDTNGTGFIAYNSAFSAYRTLEERKNNNWAKSNETVAKIGGWRTYANQAYQANKAKQESKMPTVAAEKTVTISAVNSPVATPIMDMPKPEQAIGTEANSDGDLSKSAPQINSGLAYTSVIKAHRPYEEVTLKNWKSANDTVGEIGGWRTYANRAYKAKQQQAKMAGTKP